MILLLFFAYSPLLVGFFHFLYHQSVNPSSPFNSVLAFYGLMLFVSAICALLVYRLRNQGQSVFTGMILVFTTVQLLSALSYLTYMIFTFGKSSKIDVLSCCVGFFVLLMLQSYFLIRLSRKS
jgi:hypothetical protein